MQESLGEEIQVCSNEVPGVMYDPVSGALNIYKVVYREMLKIIFLKNCCTDWDNI